MVRNIVSQALGERFKMFNDSLFIDSRFNTRGISLSQVSNSPNSLSKNVNSLDKNLISFSQDAIMPGANLQSANIFKNNSSEEYLYSFSLNSSVLIGSKS